MATTKEIVSQGYDPKKLKITINSIVVSGLSAFERLTVNKNREESVYTAHFQSGSSSLPKLMPLITGGLVEFTVEYPNCPALNMSDKVYLESICTQAGNVFGITDLIFKTKKAE